MVAVVLAFSLCLGCALLATHGELLARALWMPTLVVSTIATPRCPVPVVNALAASTLGQVRLATGVRNLARHDFRPTDNVRHFSVGQKVFLTFVVATKHAGTVEVTYCTAGRRIAGRLAVPAGAAGRYAEFALRLADADVGSSGAVLRWDGAVAAVVTFVVTPD